MGHRKTSMYRWIFHCKPSIWGVCIHGETQMFVPHLPGEGSQILSERPPSFFLPSYFFLPPSSPDITCQLVGAVRLAGLQLPHHLPARECSESRRTSSAALLDCICRLLIAVSLVRLLQCNQICGPRQTCTSRELLRASPDFYGSKIARRTFTPRKSLWASPDFLRLEKTQKECQIRMPDHDQNARKNARENVRWNAR